MTDRDHPHRSDYDEFYSEGGWRYSARRERRSIVKRIIGPLKLERGLRLLELGCGMGFHSSLFSKQGFRVVGVDASKAGIDYARDHFPGPSFLNLDAMDLSSELEHESFDVIFVRGMSWYHYELDGVNSHGVDVPGCTRELFRFLTKGGVFILQIRTDFSGRRPDGEVHHNRFDDYVGLFEPLGEIVLVSDWKGKVIRNQVDAAKSGKNIIIAARKA